MHVFQSLLDTLTRCLSLYLMQVDSAWAAGNYAEAQRSANLARILNFIGIGVGIGAWVVVGIAVIANIAVAASNPYYD